LQNNVKRRKQKNKNKKTKTTTTTTNTNKTKQKAPTLSPSFRLCFSSLFSVWREAAECCTTLNRHREWLWPAFRLSQGNPHAPLQLIWANGTTAPLNVPYKIWSEKNCPKKLYQEQVRTPGRWSKPWEGSGRLTFAFLSFFFFLFSLFLDVVVCRVFKEHPRPELGDV
jgi:hypothetical protein